MVHVTGNMSYGIGNLSMSYKSQFQENGSRAIGLISQIIVQRSYCTGCMSCIQENLSHAIGSISLVIFYKSHVMMHMS